MTWSRRLIIYFFLALGTVITIYPLLFSFLAGFWDKDLFGGAARLMPIPDKWLTTKYAMFFGNDAFRPFLNSFLRVFWYAFYITVMAVLIGYVLSRLRFPGRKLFFVFILAVQLIPSSLMFIPTYVEMARFPLIGGNDLMGQGGTGFINHPLVLYVMIGGASFMWVYLFRQAMNGLPKDYEEAAYIDGSGFFRTLFLIIVPIQKPIIATIILSNAIATWNDFLTPFIYISDQKFMTMAGYVGLLVSRLTAFGSRDYPLVFALATVTTIPPLLIFLFMQKYIVQGFASAGIKG
ncbi:carbohydrate ABC transporter permease [Cohnella silvisoli]|uniref:Carbohydrate ABC transporter permease n=1 Tax=Cohnella silvisoli TaxID=2873699 RepID=A0ABV1KTB4_9BACL|nr:carbohydrate ABC transporter permease [Cohnella silvisoli]MCD9021540.1 carbohydrate ABC transporter permease [Cohnella silvisoli]